MPHVADVESVSGVSYRIEGDITPALHCKLDGSRSVYFEHHVLFWKSSDVAIKLHVGQGAVRRLITKMPVVLVKADGVGAIAFSRDAPGQIVPIHLAPGEGVIVRENQWLAATDNVAFTPRHQRGLGNILFGGNTFWLDYFEVPADADSDGVLWLHGFGNVFASELQSGESIDVEPGGWIYMTKETTMKEHPVGLRAGLMAGHDQMILNRFSGPGRVGLQSMYYHPQPAGKNAAPSLTQGTDSE